MDLHTFDPVGAPPLGSPRPERGKVGVFLLGVAVGGTIALAAVALSSGAGSPDAERSSAPARPPSGPASELPGAYGSDITPRDFSDVKVPPPPEILPEHPADEAPEGLRFDPLHSGLDLYELPPGPGHFLHAGLSFRFPDEWELVPTGGYHGLTGNTLWLGALGVSERDHAMIQALYWPWKYSDRQMRRMARETTKGIAQVQRGRLLTQPRSFRTGGVTVHWLDFVSETPTGDAVTRAYHFAWNDTQYYVACKQSLSGDEPVIAGCDEIFSSLELGVY